MKKQTLNVLCGGLLHDYANNQVTVVTSKDRSVMEAIILDDIPDLIIVGERTSCLVMIRHYEGDEMILCFLEFKPLPDFTSMQLRKLMEPGEVGWNRVMQKSWSLGFSTEMDTVTGNFIGNYDRSDSRPSILPEGQFFRLYLEVLSTYAEKASLTLAAS